MIRIRYKDILSVVLAISFLITFGCENPFGSDPKDPDPTVIGEWYFPPDSLFVLKLLTNDKSIVVGDTLNVNVVLYNMSFVYGAAIEISYDAAVVQLEGVYIGPFMQPDSELISIAVDEPDSNRVSYGITFIAGSDQVIHGSGIIVKLKFIAMVSGVSSFSVNRENLEIIRPNGNLIFNMNDLLFEDLSVTIE